MANGKTKYNEDNEESGEEEELPSQQGSDDSNNDELFALAAKEFKMTWEKQVRAREAKAIQRNQDELDKCIKSKRQEMDGILENIDTLYNDFLLQYAMFEDRKRMIMDEIMQKKQTLLALAIRRHQGFIELGQDVEEGDLMGLAHYSQADQDFERVCNGLLHANGV